MAPDDAERFAGTAAYYARHRPGYGIQALDYLVGRYDLDDDSRVLDLGCGAGQIALPIAEHAGTVVGMDPNEAMLEQARRRAAAAGVDVEWVRGADSDLDGSLGPLTLTTMGRSFHWMDQAATLDTLFELTVPGGGVAILDDPEWLTRGDAVWQAATREAVDGFVDLPEKSAEDYDPWDEVVADHGFDDVETVAFTVERTWDAESIVGYVFSLSFCSPETLGDRRDAVEAAIRDRLASFDRPEFVQRADVSVISGRK